MRWPPDLENKVNKIAKAVSSILGLTEYVIFKLLSFAALLYLLYRVAKEHFR